MDKSFDEIIMNPVRSRIIQYILQNGTASTADIAAVLPDTPTPTLYRHMKLLSDSGIIEVYETRACRGAVEKTYRIKESSASGARGMIEASLASAAVSFAEYFSSPDAEPEKDLCGVSTTELMLTDREYLALLRSIAELYSQYSSTPPSSDRRARRITIISAPTKKDGK